MSKGQEGTLGVDVKLQKIQDGLVRAKLDMELLQWERDHYAEMEKVPKTLAHRGATGFPRQGSGKADYENSHVRFQVDSEVDFQIPEKTSGYSSGMGTNPFQAMGMSSQVSPLKDRGMRNRESTPLRGYVSETPAPVEALSVDNDRDDAQSFVSNQSFMGQGRQSTNPFLQDIDIASPKRLHSEPLSLATRPKKAANMSAEGRVLPVMSPTVKGTVPLKESNVCVEGEGKMLERNNRRPNITPDRYSGKVLWREYHRHFESCREVNEWNEEQSARYLSASLQGNALRILGDASPDRKRTYGELVKLLERRFGSGRQSENYLVELRHRRQGPKESLQELGQAIHELTLRAYPEIQEESRERLAKNHFLDAVDSRSVREGINRARPKNLDEAIRAALETDNFEKVEQQRILDGKPPKLARAIDSGLDQRVEKMEANLEVQAQTLKTMVDLLGRLSSQSVELPAQAEESPQGRKKIARGKVKEWRCFNCDNRGHFARDCRKPPKKAVSDQGNGSQPNGGPTERLEVREGPRGSIMATQ